MKHLLNFSLLILLSFVLSSFQFSSDDHAWKKIVVQNGVEISYAYENFAGEDAIIQLKLSNTESTDRMVQWDNRYLFENGVVIRSNPTLEPKNKSIIHAGETLIQRIKMMDVSTLLGSIKIQEFTVYNLQISAINKSLKKNKNELSN